jgi:hypothetical protein
VAGQGDGGRLDVGKVGEAFGERRGDGDDGHVEAGARLRVQRGQVPAGGQGGGEGLRGHVLDVRLRPEQALDPLVGHFVADHVVAGVDRPHGQG